MSSTELRVLVEFASTCKLETFTTLCARFLSSTCNRQPICKTTATHSPGNTAKCIITESEYMTPSEREDHGFAGFSRLDSPRPGV